MRLQAAADAAEDDNIAADLWSRTAEVGVIQFGDTRYIVAAYCNGATWQCLGADTIREDDLVCEVRRVGTAMTQDNRTESYSEATGRESVASRASRPRRDRVSEILRCARTLGEWSPVDAGLAPCGCHVYLGHQGGFVGEPRTQFVWLPHHDWCPTLRRWSVSGELA